jgi:hypothetical protein
VACWSLPLPPLTETPLSVDVLELLVELDVEEVADVVSACATAATTSEPATLAATIPPVITAIFRRPRSRIPMVRPFPIRLPC